MIDLLKVAFRNVGRNKRRTLITVITMFLGVLVTTATRGLLNGLQGEMRSGLTRKMHGDLQVHRRGYQDSLESSPFKLLFPWGSDAVQALKQSAAVVDAAPRLRVMGLLNHQKSQTTTPVALIGIDSARELSVCPRFAQALQSGEMIDAAKESFEMAADDEALEEAPGLDGTQNPSAGAERAGPKAGGYHQMLVTPSLMRGLNAQLGDELVVLLQDKDNMQQALIARLTGVIDYGMIGAAGRMAWVDFSTLQRVTGTLGSVGEVAIRAVEGVDHDLAKADLQSRVPADQIVETYLDIGGFFRDAFGIQNMVFSAILAIVFVIVIASIVNTSMMTVMERTREIGALMALGYRRRHILLLFLGEAAVIGLSGGVTGLIAATTLVHVLAAKGIKFALPGQSVQVSIFPNVSVGFTLFVLALAVLGALIAGLVPAYRASRMKPVQALATA